MLAVPDGVDVRKVDLSIELQILAYHEQRKSLAGDGAATPARGVGRGGAGMSVLVVGVSHHTAPVALLERLALDGDGVEKLVQAVHHTDHVQESTVLATCNRIEIYTDVDRFHGSVEAICTALCDLSGEPVDSVVPHLYVHYDDGAISHLFHVAAGLDSMVVGEGQILGQTREALRMGQELGTVGPALNAAFQQALRVAKRTHAETEIDRVAPSLVSVSLARAERARRPPGRQARRSSSAPARWRRSPSPRCRGSASPRSW